MTWTTKSGFKTDCPCNSKTQSAAVLQRVSQNLWRERVMTFLLRTLLQAEEQVWGRVLTCNDAYSFPSQVLLDHLRNYRTDCFAQASSIRSCLCLLSWLCWACYCPSWVQCNSSYAQVKCPNRLQAHLSSRPKCNLVKFVRGIYRPTILS